MNRELVLRHSIALIYLAIIFVAAGLILVRFMGWLFFASTLPLWVLVPIFAILGLLAQLLGSGRPRLIVTIILFGAYLLSVIFYGWDSMMARLNVHHEPITFDLVEAAIIIFFTVNCVVLARRA